MNRDEGAIDRRARCALTILDGFLAMTALLGGAGLATGRYTPPRDLLAGSLFGSYLVPGLALGILVGGMSAAAATLLVRRSPWGVLASGLAGLILLVFEGVELAVIGFTGLLALEVLLGLVLLALAARLRPAMWPVFTRGHRTI